MPKVAYTKAMAKLRRTHASRSLKYRKARAHGMAYANKMKYKR